MKNNNYLPLTLTLILFSAFTPSVNAQTLNQSNLAQQEAASQVTLPPNDTLSQTPPLAGNNTIEDEITVIGERTGPRLWRIEKGDAETFVLVGVGYIPRDLEWNENQVAQVLEEAQEVLLSPDAQLGAANNTRLIGTLIRTMIFNRGRIMMKKGTTLADKVGPELAAEYEKRRVALETKKITYELRKKAEKKAKKENKKGTEINDIDLDNDDDRALTEEEKKNNALIEKQIAKLKPERFHPFMQSGNLRSLGAQSEGLSGFGRVEDRVKKMARKAKVKTRPVITLDVAFTDIKKVLKSMKSFSEETNKACIAEAIQFVDEDLPKLVGVADAWALGDVAYLKANLNEDTTTSACNKAVSNELGGLKTFDGATIEEVDLLNSWIDEISTTMEEKPGVRLAIIPVNTWLREDGALQRLEARGFTIYGPRRDNTNNNEAG